MEANPYQPKSYNTAEMARFDTGAPVGTLDPSYAQKVKGSSSTTIENGKLFSPTQTLEYAMGGINFAEQQQQHTRLFSKLDQQRYLEQLSRAREQEEWRAMQQQQQFHMLQLQAAANDSRANYNSSSNKPQKPSLSSDALAAATAKREKQEEYARQIEQMRNQPAIQIDRIPLSQTKPFRTLAGSISSPYSEGGGGGGGDGGGEDDNSAYLELNNILVGASSSGKGSPLSSTEKRMQQQQYAKMIADAAALGNVQANASTTVERKPRVRPASPPPELGAGESKLFTLGARDRPEYREREKREMRQQQLLDQALRASGGGAGEGISYPQIHTSPIKGMRANGGESDLYASSSSSSSGSGVGGGPTATGSPQQRVVMGRGKLKKEEPHYDNKEYFPSPHVQKVKYTILKKEEGGGLTSPISTTAGSYNANAPLSPSQLQYELKKKEQLQYFEQLNAQLRHKNQLLEAGGGGGGGVEPELLDAAFREPISQRQIPLQETRLANNRHEEINLAVSDPKGTPVFAAMGDYEYNNALRKKELQAIYQKQLVDSVNLSPPNTERVPLHMQRQNKDALVHDPFKSTSFPGGGYGAGGGQRLLLGERPDNSNANAREAPDAQTIQRRLAQAAFHRQMDEDASKAAIESPRIPLIQSPHYQPARTSIIPHASYHNHSKGAPPEVDPFAMYKAQPLGGASQDSLFNGPGEEAAGIGTPEGLKILMQKRRALQLEQDRQSVPITRERITLYKKPILTGLHTIDR